MSKKPEQNPQESSSLDFLNDGVDYNPFPKASDFESVRIDIKAFNITARTEVKSEPPTQFVQILNAFGMVLEVPASSCAKGHHLELHLVGADAAKGKLDMKATAKVDKVKDTAEGKQEIHITLIQFEEEHWKALTGIFTSRQEEIINFLNAAKGL